MTPAICSPPPAAASRRPGAAASPTAWRERRGRGVAAVYICGMDEEPTIPPRPWTMGERGYDDHVIVQAENSDWMVAFCLDGPDVQEIGPFIINAVETYDRLQALLSERPADLEDALRRAWLRDKLGLP